jgi:hypothetical protein
MDDSVPFASRVYFIMLGLLLFARGMDFLSTWVATPHLTLEGNPIAKWLGWKWGLVVNVGLCLGFGLLPIPAIIIATTSVLVAARNFQSAWLMRSLGEDAYRDWYVDRIRATKPPLYLVCLAGNTLLTGVVGGALIYFTSQSVPQAIGLGIVGYAVAVAFYTLLSVWRTRRTFR